MCWPARSQQDAQTLGRFRPWLYAAALYNLAWGCTAVFAPRLLVSLAGLPAASGVLVQGLGLLVLVYAPGFVWAARHPSRHGHLVAIALLGKSLGVVGFLWAAGRGTLAPAFGLSVASNDLVWLPAFALFLRALAHSSGGWRRLLAG